MWTIAALCLTALVAVTTAQPECDELGFQDRSPFTGSSLSICRSEGAQCCSDDYLEEVKEKVQDKLEDYLEEEFEDVIEEYEDEIEDLMEYFTDEFTENMLLNFPFSELLNRTDPIIQRILRRLIRNFVIRDDEDDEDEEESDETDEDEDEDEGTDEEENDESDDDDFDAGDFIRELIRAIIRSIARALGERVECIVDAVESLLDEDVIGQLIRLLRRIRRAITALMRIGRFLERQKDRFEDAEILQSCVSRFIEIAYCKRCTQKTPPMCFRTCNALVRGCYSPYYTVLNAQYQRLWEEVQTIIELANSTVSEFFSRENALMDRSAVVRTLFSACRVRVSDDDSRGSRDKRSHSDSSPSRMSTDSTDSQYSGSGSGSGEEKSGMSRSRSDTSKTMTTMTRTTKTRTTKTRTSKTDTSMDTTGNTDSSSRPKPTKPNPEEPPELPESIPFEVVDDVLALTSAFQYGMRRRNVGLKLCLDALVEDDDESCNKTDDDRDYCKGKDFCTSRCYCTDGKNFTMDDETDQAFDSNEVDDQGDNPVLDIDEDELQEQVDRIIEMGDPVGAFLASDEFTSVDPRQQDEEESDDGDNSATGLGVGTLSVLLLAALTVFL